MLELIQILFSLLSIMFGRIGKPKNHVPSPGRCPNLNPSTSIIGTTIAHQTSPPASIVTILFKLFSLFFIDEIMDKLVAWTNEYIELYPLNEETEHLRAWQPTCKQELYAYFAVLIYMGITIESSIEDYWKDLKTYRVEHIVKQYMGIVRFQQLDRHF